MTETFITRPELMPPGETREEHRKCKKEESDIVERDKAGAGLSAGGLFKGCFKSKARDIWAIRDDEDGVQRCPRCAWELEDGICSRCGLGFDDNGRPTSGNGFSDLSDEDDQSDPGFSSEDLDEDIDEMDHAGELGLDSYDFDSMTGDDPIDFPNLQPRNNYAIERAVSQGAIAFPPNRRSAAHSAAAGRRRSYTASMISDMQVSEDGEMGTLEEESEEGDEVDESLDGFLVHDESDRSRLSSSVHSIPRPSGPRRRRREIGALVESLASASQGRSTDHEDASDEGGAVSSGRRRRPRSRPQPQLSRRIGRRGPIALSVSTEADEESRDLGEDTQALLRSGWSPLDHGTGDDSVSDSTNDVDDDDDDAMTTVGIPASVSSGDRTRLGGSLTPTAEASIGAIRPHSQIRNRNGRVIDGSRGLRRRSSTVSTVSSTLTYEDGEADDDDSDEGSTSVDHDGDVEMEGTPQRDLGTRATNSTSFLSGGRNRSGLGASVGNAINLEADSASDASVRPIRRRGTQRPRQPEYNPMISAMFAQHQIEAPDVGSLAARTAWDHPRSRTPVNRPRMGNRNRLSLSTTPTQAPPFSPLSTSTISPSSPEEVSSSRSRPLHDSAAAARSSPVAISSPQSRQLNHSPATEARPTFRAEFHSSQESPRPAARPESRRSDNPSRQASASRNGANSEITNTYRVPSSGSAGLPNRSMSGLTDTSYIDPSSPSGSVHDQARSTALSGHSALVNPVNGAGMNPQAAVNHRMFSQGHDLSTSTSQGRLPSGSWVSPTPGLNFAARSLQARNPWAGYVRPRQSSTRMREQSSTATLRPHSSRRELRGQPSQSSIRDGVQPYAARPQSSRTSLRGTPSHQRLRGQATARSVVPIGPSTVTTQPPTVTSGGVALNGQRNASALPRLSYEERQRRGNEMVRRRAEELERQNSNPFTSSRTSRSGSTSSAAHLPQQQKVDPHAHHGQSQRSSSTSLSNGPANQSNTATPV